MARVISMREDIVMHSIDRRRSTDQRHRQYISLTNKWYTFCIRKTVAILNRLKFALFISDRFSRRLKTMIEQAKKNQVHPKRDVSFCVVIKDRGLWF